MRNSFFVVLLILISFLFLIPGTPLAGIVPGPEFIVGQDIISPMADCKAGVVGYLAPETIGLSLAVAITHKSYLTGKRCQYSALNNPEGGTILKGPVLWAESSLLRH